MQSVFLETSVISYLTSGPSSNLIVAGNQRLTHEWWNDHRHAFELFVSQAVVSECAAGDADEAKKRLAVLEQIPVLELDDGTRDLARALIAGVPLPQKAEIDGLHIAAAAMNSMDFRLTWNCAHIANPSLRRRIDGVLVAADVTPPVICTPQELINV